MSENKSDSAEKIEYLRYLEKEKDISDQIIDHSRSMITVINRDYNYEKVNATFCNAHKVADESVVGKSLSDVWGYDTFNRFIKSNIDLCFTGKTVRYEAVFNTPKLGKRYFEVIFRPISAGTGEITHLLAETTDIDDLMQSKRAVIEKEEEFRTFETNLPIGFLRLDPEGNILHANRAFLRIMECHDEISVTRMNIRSFYVEEGLFDMQLDQLLDSNTKNFGRVYLKNCNNDEIPCRITGYVAVNDEGTTAYIDFAIEDSSRELMLENRLQQAQKLETIGALAGGIAHDFNNILATISGYAEMLQEDLPKNSEHFDKVGRIQAAVTRGRSITNQILTFSRQVDQEKVQINVSEVLRETIAFVKSAMPAGIVIRNRITKGKTFVFADPTQLFRVFLNLMTNAFHAMEEKGGTLTVSLSVEEGKIVKHELNKDIVADEYVIITFKDTGKGMEPSLIKRIFEPFFTTRDVGKGTGLGLSVIHGIITEMEGEILVSSKKDLGSAFIIYLPVSKKYTDPSVRPDKRRKILFLTGNKHESRILSLALESSGYDLININNSENLIKVMTATEDRPDLVIYMTESKQIQQRELAAIYSRLKISTPCILITDPDQELMEEKLLNSGIIKQHLLKPVSLREISDAIQSSIK
jgi:PAS domain S-box-containing protein